MKKFFIAICVGLLLIISITVSIAVSLHINANKDIPLDKFQILMNLFYESEDGTEYYDSSVYTFVDLKVDSVEDSFHTANNDTIMARKLIDNSMFVISKEQSSIAVNIYTDDGDCKGQLYIEHLPEQVLEFNDKVLLRFEDEIYTWDYKSGSTILEKIEIPTVTKNSKIFSNNKRICVANDSSVHIYDSALNEEKRLKNKSDCLGFINEDTIVFIKQHLNGAPIILYRYNITKKRYCDFGLIYLTAGYICDYDVAFDPSGRYMFCFSPSDLGIAYAYIFDLDTFAKKSLDFDVYDLASYQWIS